MELYEVEKLAEILRECCPKANANQLASWALEFKRHASAKPIEDAIRWAALSSRGFIPDALLSGIHAEELKADGLTPERRAAIEREKAAAQAKERAEKLRRIKSSASESVSNAAQFLSSIPDDDRETLKEAVLTEYALGRGYDRNGDPVTFTAPPVSFVNRLRGKSFEDSPTLAAMMMAHVNRLTAAHAPHETSGQRADAFFAGGVK